MRVHLTRDSVSISDDCYAPHSHEMSVREDASLDEIVTLIAKSGYLPPISGGEATWSVASNLPLAVVAQQWSQPKLLFLLPTDLARMDKVGDMLRIHVNYHAQMKPDLVFEVLTRLRLRAL